MKKRYLFLSAVVGVVFAYQACTNNFSTDKNLVSTAPAIASGASFAGKASITVTEKSSGNVIYSDSNPGSLVLKAGNTYNISLISDSLPADASYSLSATRIDIPGGTAASTPLKLGDNSVTAPVQGDYAWKLSVSVPNVGVQVKSYTAAVSCPNPTFTTLSSLSVSASGNNDSYDFSVSYSAADGTAPYSVALDISGTGIVDTGFQTGTSVTFSGQRVVYVGYRKIGVVVKDACNTAVATMVNTSGAQGPQLVNLPYTVPGMPSGMNFISGKVSNEGGLLATTPDLRVNGVEYFSINPPEKVDALYNSSKNLTSYTGAFKISAIRNYGLTSSMPFGVTLQLSGISDDAVSPAVDRAYTVDVSKATIQAVSYTTDQAGDQAPPMSFGKTGSCVYSNGGGKMMFAPGLPCGPGSTGSGAHLTAEIWGEYVCSMTDNAGRTFDFSGKFDGLYNLPDSCIGGGGGGGGGVPIQNF